MSEFSQTVPELVAWARKNDFSISLPVDRLSFLLAVATLNGERLDGEMSEGELVDAFRHVSDAFEQTSETIGVRAVSASFLRCVFLCNCRLWRVSSNAQQMPPKRAVMNFTGTVMSMRH